MLGAVPGKNFSKHVRYSIVPSARAYVASTQFGGGMNQGDTGIAHVYLRCVCDLSLKLNLSMAVVFLDIVAAFASLMRKIVFDTDEGDERWLVSLREAGFSEHEIKDIYGEVCTSIDQLFNCNTVSLALASCMYQYTWASTEGLSSIMRTKSGSSAGTPLADLVYVIAISKVMFKLREKLEQQELVTKIVCSGKDVFIREVGYVDDTAIPVLAPALHLVDRTRRVAEIAKAVFGMYAMELNWNPGKSEAIAIWRGPHARKERTKLEFNKGSQIVCHAMNASFILRFVKRYKHIGTFLDCDGGIKSEIAVRSTVIKSEATRMKSRILSNRAVNKSRKIALVQAYIWSKGMFQCGSWPNLQVACYKRIHAAIMFVYRIVLGYETSITMNDDDVINELGVLCPLTLIRARRLCLLARVCQNDLIAHICHETAGIDRSWANACSSDLHWLCQFPKFGTWKGFSLLQWFADIRADPKGFKKQVMTVCVMPFANIVSQWATTKALAHLGSTYQCHLCEKVFVSKQSMCLHKFKKHGVKRVERLYIVGSRCPICLLELWTRERALNHLRRSVVCHENLLMSPPRLSTAQADELDELSRVEARDLKSKGLRRHAATIPCVQASGPLRPVIMDPERVSKHHPLGIGRNLR